MNVEALLSHDGGKGDRLNSGTGILLGVGSDLVGRYIIKPKMISQSLDVRKLYRSSKSRLSGMFKDHTKFEMTANDSYRLYLGHEDAAYKANIQGARAARKNNLFAKIKSNKTPALPNIRKAGRSDLKFYKTLSWAFLATTLVDVGLDMFTPGISNVKAKKDYLALADESYIDSDRAYTMRQRAMKAIVDSQLSPRSIIGQEAQYLMQ